MKRYVTREAAIALIGVNTIPPGNLRKWKRLRNSTPAHGKYWFNLGAKKHWARRLGARWKGPQP